MAQLIMTQTLKQEISTPGHSTEVILTLFIGETYVEVGFFDQVYITNLRQQPQSKKSNQPESTPVLHSQLFYIPHQSLKSIFTQIKKIIAEKNYNLNETFFVSRYLERLQNFRLGGSVAQLIPAGFENNIHFGNSLSLSLANPSLIISKAKASLTAEELQLDIDQIKKINPDCDKVIAYDFTESFVNETLTKNGFQVFHSSLALKSHQIRKTLFNAGVSGTLKELFAELGELVQKNPASVWVNGSWFNFAEIQAATEYPKDFAVNMFMSGLNFLYHFNQRTHPDSPTQFHIDFDNWETIKSTPSQIWKSPWGEVECVAPLTKEPLPISPRQEILIDDTARLQISKNSTSIETGPFIAGRSVKSVVIDLFSDEILSQAGLYKMIGSPDLNLLNAKIKSQFKALENGQNQETHISCAELKNLINDSIQTRITFDSANCKEDSLITGNLGFLFNAKNSNQEGFFWSQSMIKTAIIGAQT